MLCLSLRALQKILQQELRFLQQSLSNYCYPLKHRPKPRTQVPSRPYQKSHLWEVLLRRVLEAMMMTNHHTKVLCKLGHHFTLLRLRLKTAQHQCQIILPSYLHQGKMLAVDRLMCSKQGVPLQQKMQQRTWIPAPFLAVYPLLSSICYHLWDFQSR
ncbi:hypothetical protein DIPPA_56413 [Diplonema papillatum]|nr:hypothetical protein DIPPA_56413 [Diplonema papillatum]